MKRKELSFYKFPIVTLEICIFLTALFVAIGSWNAWVIYSNTVKSWEKSSETQRISKEIIYLDEVLTMSALMGASTGKSFWEKRYRQHESELTKLIETLQKISSTNGVKTFAKKTESANNALVAMENKAFVWIREGKVDKAKNILSSKEYEEQKQIYSKGIRDLIKKVELQNQKDISQNTNKLFAFYLICGFVLLASLVAGLIVLQKYFTQLKRSKTLSSTFGHILDNSFNEIYVFDASSLKFLQVSPGASRNLQYSMQELTQLTALDLKPEFNKETIGDLVKPLVLREKSTLNFETVHKRKDGSLYPIEVRLQLMHEETPPVFVAIGLDITQRKNDQEKLKTYADELKKKQY